MGGSPDANKNSSRVAKRVKKNARPPRGKETGTVKFFNEAKGYGFIIDEKTKNEVIVHVAGLVDEIKEDDHVTFDYGQDRKGPIAENVQLAR